MNRLARTFPSLDLFLADTHAETLDALVMNRQDLIAIVKRAAYDFHQHRQRTRGNPGEQEAVAQSTCRDQVLGWLKATESENITLLAGRSVPP